MTGQNAKRTEQTTTGAGQVCKCGATIAPRTGGHGKCARCYQQDYRASRRAADVRMCAAGCGSEVVDRGKNGHRVTCSAECARVYRRQSRQRTPADRVRLAEAVIRTVGKLAGPDELAGLWALAEEVEAAQVEAIDRLRRGGLSWSVIGAAVGKSAPDLLKWHQRHTDAVWKRSAEGIQSTRNLASLRESMREGR